MMSLCQKPIQQNKWRIEFFNISYKTHNFISRLALFNFFFFFLPILGYFLYFNYVFRVFRFIEINTLEWNIEQREKVKDTSCILLNFLNKIDRAWFSLIQCMVLIWIWVVEPFQWRWKIQEKVMAKKCDIFRW